MDELRSVSLMYAEHGHPVLRKKITTSISARGSKNSK